MSKKTVDDVNGVSRIEITDEVRGKKNTNKTNANKKTENEVESREETEEKAQATETIQAESIAEEKTEELETAVDPVQAAVDEEFMQLAIDAAITG